MSDSAYLRDVARRCQRLSQACFDLSVSEQLRRLPDELVARADEPQRSAVPMSAVKLTGDRR